jgi:hypothetical protein
MTNKIKSISELKKFFLIALLVVIAFLTVVTNNVFADKKSKPLSSHRICLQVKEKNYDNVDVLLSRDASLNKLKLNDNGEPDYTKEQIKELRRISTDCYLSRAFPVFPFEVYNAISNFNNRVLQHLG